MMACRYSIRSVDASVQVCACGCYHAMAVEIRLTHSPAVAHSLVTHWQLGEARNGKQQAMAAPLFLPAAVC
jgi:hypothetical protein